jgi:hypothetical protein
VKSKINKLVRRCCVCGLIWAGVCTANLLAAEPLQTRNVVLVTLDGVRVQEIFAGLDETIAVHDAEQEYSEIVEVRQRYPGMTAEQRRAALLPNFWTRLALQGQVFGNAAYDNHVKVQNRILWSTPGYVEMLTGAPRADVTDNVDHRFAYKTALELAREKLGLGFGEVAQIGSWDGYSLAAASSDDAFLMVGTHDAVPGTYGNPRLAELAGLRREIMGLWSEGSNDTLTFRMAQAYLEKNQPRVMWLALVNSDDWAHADRYDRYLEYLHLADGFLGELWDTLQASDFYRDQTTLIITTDHGRGLQGKDWAEHDITIPGSDAIWMAVIGPDTPDVGEVQSPGTLYQGQVAATLLYYLGVDYRELGAPALPPVGVSLARD